MTDPGPHVPDYDRKGCEVEVKGERCGAKPVRYDYRLRKYACFGRNTPDHSLTGTMGDRRRLR